MKIIREIAPNNYDGMPGKFTVHQHFPTTKDLAEHKPILYVDMDGVVADFEKAVSMLDPSMPWGAPECHDRVEALCMQYEDIFEDLDVMPDAVASVAWLSKYYDVYFLSTPMDCVPASFTGKKNWINRHFPAFKKRLILTHRKDLQIGHYLIDDRKAHGADNFCGVHIHFGQDPFPDWLSIVSYLVHNKPKPTNESILTADEAKSDREG